jgi:hypothetical protein
VTCYEAEHAVSQRNKKREIATDGRVSKLAFLSLLSAALCVVALIYNRLIETSVFAGLTFGIPASGLPAVT